MNHTISLFSTIQRKQELLTSKIDNEIVLLDVDLGSYFGMNPIASRIWELIENPQTIAHICNILINEYEIDLEKCQKEVINFLTELLTKKIIHVIPS